MELRVLKYFLMAAREQNITKAAQALHITQPTLSRQLMALEEELGVKLFERSSHSISLTGDGLLLKRRAQEIVSLEEKTVRELALENTLGGELEIGSGEFKSFSVFSDMMLAFREQNPNVSFRLYSGNADNIKERIENGILDMGVLSYPVDISRYEFVHIPKSETWGILVHRDFEIAEKEFVTPQDLAEIPLLMPGRRLVQSEIENWFGDFYDKLNVFAVYDLQYNAAVIAQKKVGAVLTIELKSRYDNLKFIPFYPELKSDVVLVWKKNRVRSASAEAFVSFAKEYLGGISDNAK